MPSWFFENKLKHLIMLRSFNPNLAAVTRGPAVCSFKKTQKILCFSVTYRRTLFCKKNYKTDPRPHNGTKIEILCKTQKTPK
jgi:hypothetical protein